MSVCQSVYNCTVKCNNSIKLTALSFYIVITGINLCLTINFLLTFNGFWNFKHLFYFQEAPFFNSSFT